jgi:type I restriction enzyme S subunit
LKQLQTAFARSLIKSELPDNWSLFPLGEAILATEYGLNDPTAADGNVPIVGMREISDGIVSLSSRNKIVGCPGGLVNQMLRVGDILINRTNSPDLVGKCGIVRENAPSVFASYLVRLSVNPEKADPEYINYWMNSRTADVAVKRISTRAVSQANINPTELLKNCPLPLPPLPEQHKIAEILRTWDEALEKLTALRAAKEKHLSALRFGMLFGELRLKGQRRNWVPTRLATVTHELTARNGTNELGRDYVMGVTKAQGVVPMREQTISGDISRYKRLPSRAFAYNPMRINVGSIAINKRDEEVLVSPDYVVFACNADGLDPDYLDHLRKTSWWAHYINSSGSGSVRQRTYYDDLAALKLPLPELEEQKAIAAVLNTARDDLAATEREIEAVTLQKRGLMQKLLTGEWRVLLDPNETTANVEEDGHAG